MKIIYKMKLVVWLWNPWIKYKNTRHNIWFFLLDEFCNRNWFNKFEYNNKFYWEISIWNIWEEKIFLLKPMTFMNLSWKSILSLVNFYKLQSDDIVLIYDDIDLPTAKLRLKKWWSAWWHNWVKDTINKLWTDNFFRLKIWVDRPKDKSLIVNYVLWSFTKTEIDSIINVYDDFEQKLNTFLNNEF